MPLRGIRLHHTTMPRSGIRRATLGFRCKFYRHTTKTGVEPFAVIGMIAIGCRIIGDCRDS